MALKSLAICLFFASLQIGARAQQFPVSVFWGPQFNCTFGGNCVVRNSPTTFHTALIGGTRTAYTSCNPCFNGQPFGWMELVNPVPGSFSSIDKIYPAADFPITGLYNIDTMMFGQVANGDYPTVQMLVDGGTVDFNGVKNFFGIPLSDRVKVDNAFATTAEIYSNWNVSLKGGQAHRIQLRLVPPAGGNHISGNLYVSMVAVYPFSGSNTYVQATCNYSVNGVFGTTAGMGKATGDRNLRSFVVTCQNYAAAQGHPGAQIYINLANHGPIGGQNCGFGNPACLMEDVQ